MGKRGRRGLWAGGGEGGKGGERAALCGGRATRRLWVAVVGGFGWGRDQGGRAQDFNRECIHSMRMYAYAQLCVYTVFDGSVRIYIDMQIDRKTDKQIDK